MEAEAHNLESTTSTKFLRHQGLFISFKLEPKQPTAHLEININDPIGQLA